MVLIHFCRHSEAWHSCLSKDNTCHTSGSNISALHTLGAESAMVLKQMAALLHPRTARIVTQNRVMVDTYAIYHPFPLKTWSPP